MSQQSIAQISVDQILVNPDQPREIFGVEGIGELAASIKSEGLLHPITVEGPHFVAMNSSDGDNKTQAFILIDGERRLRAVKQLGFTNIRCLVSPPTEIGPERRLVLAVIANMQRADLNPIEEARAFKRMKEQLGLSVNEISQKIGSNSTLINSRLKLLELEEPVQALIMDGRLPKDSRLVNALLGIENAEHRVELAKTLSARGASVKAGVEACVRLGVHVREKAIDRNETPSIRLATVKAGVVNKPNYDVFIATGSVPPWALVEASAKKVCDACPVRQQASSSACSGCALVEIITDLIERAK